MTDLTSPINGLVGALNIECIVPSPSDHSSSCKFKQQTLISLFGSDGLALDECTFGECVRQSVIDGGGNLTNTTNSSMNSGPGLGGGVIAGLAVVGGLVLFALLILLWGLWLQRKARFSGMKDIDRWRVALEWTDLTYIIPTSQGPSLLGRLGRDSGDSSDKTVLNALNGRVDPGKMMAILGPSGRSPFISCCASV